MTDVNPTPDTPTNTTETTDNNPAADNTTAETCRWHKCRPFADQHGWHVPPGGKKKVVLGVFLIALLAFMAGKGCSHPHGHWQHRWQAEQPAVTQSYNGQNQQMPLSMMLDGIAATPEQRAKAVDLLH
jgi:hypothetical protein